MFQLQKQKFLFKSRAQHRLFLAFAAMTAMVGIIIMAVGSLWIPVGNHHHGSACTADESLEKRGVQALVSDVLASPHGDVLAVSGWEETKR